MLMASGTISVSTDVNGYATIQHSLGAVPGQVFVTYNTPNTAFVSVDQKTSTSFRIHVMRPWNNAPFMGTVTVDWLAVGSDVPAPATGPLGSSRAYTLAFVDDFNGTSLDTAKWTVDSSSQKCHTATASGNEGNNQQLELNTLSNLSFGNSILTMTAKRQNVVSPCSSHVYAWTSGLITSKYIFQYGWIEERSKLPAPKGFWPAFWTWQAPGVNVWDETDVYEFYSDNHTKLYMTKHPNGSGGVVTPSFDPTTGFHVYGADIRPDGIDFYLDGKKVASSVGTAQAGTNIISNLAVYSQIPPDSTTQSATKQVDYIKVWK